MIITNGKLLRGKFRGYRLWELSDDQLVATVGGFNISKKATQPDRKLLAAELLRRGLSVPKNFVDRKTSSTEIQKTLLF